MGYLSEKGAGVVLLLNKCEKAPGVIRGPFVRVA